MVTRTVAILLSLGCGGAGASRVPGVDGAVADAWPLALAVGRAETGAFVAYADGDAAGIVRGFQGALMTVVSLRAAGTNATEADVIVSIDAEGLPTAWFHDVAPLRAGDDGARYADDLYVAMSTTRIADVTGRRATVAASLRAGACAGIERRTVLLVDGASDGGRP